jgi:hypothetical protein
MLERLGFPRRSESCRGISCLAEFPSSMRYIWIAPFAVRIQLHASAYSSAVSWILRRPETVEPWFPDQPAGETDQRSAVRWSATTDRSLFRCRGCGGRTDVLRILSLVARLRLRPRPSVPPGDRDRCVPDGMWMPVPWRSCFDVRGRSATCAAIPVEGAAGRVSRMLPEALAAGCGQV